METVLKTVGAQALVGSNPTPSATNDTSRSAKPTGSMSFLAVALRYTFTADDLVCFSISSPVTSRRSFWDMKTPSLIFIVLSAIPAVSISGTRP